MIPRLLVVFTQKLEILVTTLKPIINSDHIIILTLSSKFRMYEALVAPYFDYCSKVWACTGKGQTPEIAK